MSIPHEELERLLVEWLPVQRWFSGKGRQMSVTARPLTTLGEESPEVSIWLAEVAYESGATEIYQLPLILRDEPVAALDHVLVGSIWIDGQPHWVYDALHDKQVTQAWLQAIHDELTTDRLDCARYVSADQIPLGEPSLVLTAEQSNTSLIFGDAAILKVFRRVEPGTNPDIEAHEALGRVDGAHIAALLGSISGRIDGQSASLAMLSEFLTTATDGWELAKISVRDLMAEGDLHADEAGGDFGGEAHRLGQAVAEVHENLALAFGTETIGAAELRQRADAMHERLDAAVDVVPALAVLAPEIHGVYERFAAYPTPVPVQRIHGDLHLGQVLRTVHRWVVIDFEGEPVKQMSERRMFDSALRDVAGMLRSFVYVARHQIVDFGDTPQLEYRAVEWIDRNRDEFCQGYAQVAGHDPRESNILLRGYEFDKAVYETVYEARNRPNWLAIPLSSLRRMVARLEEARRAGAAQTPGARNP